jgi:hypothetical protein
MLMDYGATFKDLKGIAGQSLIFENIEPRVLYHSGLLFSTLSFMILTTMCAHYLYKEKSVQQGGKEEPEKEKYKREY